MFFVKIDRQALTNLLELLFRTVFAFPKASNKGLDSRMTSLIFYLNKKAERSYFYFQT